MNGQQPSLGSAIGKLRDLILQNLRRRFATYDGTRLTTEEYILLYRIHQERETIILQDLADATGKSKSTIFHTIDSLESKGVLTREVNPNDRRQNHLIITDQGLALFNDYFQMEQELTQQLLHGIPDKQIQDFLHTIDRIKANQLSN